MTPEDTLTLGWISDSDQQIISSALPCAMAGTIHKQQADLHRWSDEALHANRIADSIEREHAFYITLMAIAQEPETSRRKFVFRRHSISHSGGR